MPPVARAGLALGGVAAGSLLSEGVGRFGNSVLQNAGLQNRLIPNALTNGLGASAYTLGEVGGDELGRTLTEQSYAPDWNRIGGSAASAFAFSTLNGLLQSAAVSQRNKAYIQQDLDDVRQQYDATVKALSDPTVSPEQRARLAQSTIDNADWMRRRLDDMNLYGAQREVSAAQDALAEIAEEMKPYARTGSNQLTFDPLGPAENKPFTSLYGHGTMQASGKLGDTDGFSTITNSYHIESNNQSAISTELDSFGKRFQTADTEHSLVLSPTGETFEVSGLSGLVNTELVGADALKGSTVIHNHPV